MGLYGKFGVGKILVGSYLHTYYRLGILMTRGIGIGSLVWD